MSVLGWAYLVYLVRCLVYVCASVCVFVCTCVFVAEHVCVCAITYNMLACARFYVHVYICCVC